MKQLTILTLATLSIALQASATINFDLQAEKLQDSSGASIGVNSLVMLVADTGGNGFSSLQPSAALSAGSFLNGSDDQVLARFNLSSTATAGEIAVSPTLALSGSWATGNPLALLWFPTLTTASTTAPAGTTYGIFTGSTLDGSSAWVTPTNGANGYKLYFFTTAATDLPLTPPGHNAAALGKANLTIAAVPEPSRVMLVGLGLGAFIVRRRRNA
jgi:hypothetical protein